MTSAPFGAEGSACVLFDFSGDIWMFCLKTLDGHPHLPGCHLGWALARSSAVLCDVAVV
ncbi:hypothetical protein LHK_01669 [Laribacter hongkongensis HLHK9]|uniref:Uncharacterized protein n=1 Tax=Laribacter hongkongensis (strain HLHK9) TaxID=557598 RepID=C1D863_LARHH|nr:hypothetical protein LHK_01669 [Laribacter hongkongensis HLHK9]